MAGSLSSGGGGGDPAEDQIHAALVMAGFAAAVLGAAAVSFHVGLGATKPAQPDCRAGRCRGSGRPAQAARLFFDLLRVAPCPPRTTCRCHRDLADPMAATGNQRERAGTGHLAAELTASVGSELVQIHSPACDRATSLLTRSWRGFTATCQSGSLLPVVLRPGEQHGRRRTPARAVSCGRTAPLRRSGDLALLEVGLGVLHVRARCRCRCGRPPSAGGLLARGGETATRRGSAAKPSSTSNSSSAEPDFTHDRDDGAAAELYRAVWNPPDPAGHPTPGLRPRAAHARATPAPP